MTDEQIKSISWICKSHILLAGYYHTVYEAEGVPFRLIKYTSVPTDECRERYKGARSVTTYRLNWESMRRKKLTEKLKEIEL